MSTVHNNFPQSAVLATPDVARCAFFFIHYESTLLALVQLGIHSNPQVLFTVAAIQQVSSYPELTCGVILLQGQNYGLPVEVCNVGYLFKIMRVCLERLIFCLVGHSADLVLSSNLPRVPCFIKCYMFIAHCSMI